VSCYNVKKKNGYNIRVPYIRSILQADFAGLRQKVVVWLSFAPGGGTAEIRRLPDYFPWSVSKSFHLLVGFSMTIPVPACAERRVPYEGSERLTNFSGRAHIGTIQENGEAERLY